MAEIELKEKDFKLSKIRLDRARENLTSEIKSLCNKNGIKLEPYPPHAPQSKGATERFIQEHWTRARVLLFASNLPISQWPGAINHGNW